jgi:hypothetical protein
MEHHKCNSDDDEFFCIFSKSDTDLVWCVLITIASFRSTVPLRRYCSACQVWVIYSTVPVPTFQWIWIIKLYRWSYYYHRYVVGSGSRAPYSFAWWTLFAGEEVSVDYSVCLAVFFAKWHGKSLVRIFIIQYIIAALSWSGTIYLKTLTDTQKNENSQHK